MNALVTLAARISAVLFLLACAWGVLGLLTLLALKLWDAHQRTKL